MYVYMCLCLYLQYLQYVRRYVCTFFGCFVYIHICNAVGVFHTYEHTYTYTCEQYPFIYYHERYHMCCDTYTQLTITVVFITFSIPIPNLVHQRQSQTCLLECDIWFGWYKVSVLLRRYRTKGIQVFLSVISYQYRFSTRNTRNNSVC